MYSDTPTDVHADPHIKKMYIYIIIVTLIVVMIGRINDFIIINLVHKTPIGITYYNTKYNIQVFHRFRLSSRLIYILTIITENIY